MQNDDDLLGLFTNTTQSTSNKNDSSSQNQSFNLSMNINNINDNTAGMAANSVTDEKHKEAFDFFESLSSSAALPTVSPFQANSNSTTIAMAGINNNNNNNFNSSSNNNAFDPFASLQFNQNAYRNTAMGQPISTPIPFDNTGNNLMSTIPNTTMSSTSSTNHVFPPSQLSSNLFSLSATTMASSLQPTQHIHSYPPSPSSSLYSSPSSQPMPLSSHQQHILPITTTAPSHVMSSNIALSTSPQTNSNANNTSILPGATTTTTIVASLPSNHFHHPIVTAGNTNINPGTPSTFTLPSASFKTNISTSSVSPPTIVAATSTPTPTSNALLNHPSAHTNVISTAPATTSQVMTPKNSELLSSSSINSTAALINKPPTSLSPKFVATAFSLESTSKYTLDKQINPSNTMSNTISSDNNSLSNTNTTTTDQEHRLQDYQHKQDSNTAQGTATHSQIKEDPLVPTEPSLQMKASSSASSDNSLIDMDLDSLQKISGKDQEDIPLDSSNEQTANRSISELFTNQPDSSQRHDPFTDLLFNSPDAINPITYQKENQHSTGLSSNNNQLGRVSIQVDTAAGGDMNKENQFMPSSPRKSISVNLVNFPFRQWIQPTVFQDLASVDTVTELGNKVLGPFDRPVRKIIKSSDIISSDPKDILKALLSQKSYRATAEYAKQILLNNMDPTLIDEIQRLFIIRWHAMAQLGFFPLVEQEMKTIGIDSESTNDPFKLFKGKEWSFEAWYDLFPGQYGHLISFETRMFCAKWPSFKGNFHDTVNRLYFILFDLDNEMEMKSRQQNDDRSTSSLKDLQILKQRYISVHLHLATAFFQMNDVLMAIKILNTLLIKIEKDSLEHLFHVQNFLGRLYLAVGHIAKAESIFLDMEKYVLNGFPWDNSSPDREIGRIPLNVLSNSTHGPILVCNKVLVLLAKDQYEEARHLYISLMSKYPQQKVLYINNASILSLYTGHLVEAVTSLEQLLKESPSIVANQSIYLFNLATLYDLSYQSQERKKSVLKGSIYSFAGDTFVADCLKM